MNEGVAEYTGMVLSHFTEDEKLNYFERTLPIRKDVPSFVRSFAYISGPLYGVLLDEKNNQWRENLSIHSDLGEHLENAYEIDSEIPNEKSLIKRAKSYNYKAVFENEQIREEKRLKRISKFREIFIDGKVLTLNFRQMKIQFNPSNLIPLDDIGTVYPTMRISDDWGILTVSENALLSKNWDFVKVSAESIEQSKNMIVGEGWELKLDENWELKSNDLGYTIVEKEN